MEDLGSTSKGLGDKCGLLSPYSALLEPHAQCKVKLSDSLRTELLICGPRLFLPHQFAMNAVTDMCTLPHIANLYLCGEKPAAKCQLCPERQTLHHVLNQCSIALEEQRYNQQHDAVLALLYKLLSSHLQTGCQVIADLPEEHYYSCRMWLQQTAGQTL